MLAAAVVLIVARATIAQEPADEGLGPVEVIVVDDGAASAGEPAPSTAPSPKVTGDDSDWGFDLLRFDLRSAGVVGFFPLGGNYSAEQTSLSSEVIGFGIDTLNLNWEHKRFSFINGSAFLLGVNYAKLVQDPQSTTWVDLAYVRVGPHFRWDGLWDDRFSLGGEFGYAALLHADTLARQTGVEHGIDLSITITWTQHEGRHGENARRSSQQSSEEPPKFPWGPVLGVAGAVAGLAGGAGGAYLLAKPPPDIDEDLAVVGGTLLLTMGLTLAVAAPMIGFEGG